MVPPSAGVMFHLGDLGAGRDRAYAVPFQTFGSTNAVGL